VTATHKIPRGPGIIYFALDPTAKAVKIGYTEMVRDGDRLKQIQGCSANRIELAHARYGCRASERDLHERFKKHHLHGEWFRWCPEIAEHIEKTPARLRIDSARA
jgi:hypothetical protein